MSLPSIEIYNITSYLPTDIHRGFHFYQLNYTLMPIMVKPDLEAIKNLLAIHSYNVSTFVVDSEIPRSTIDRILRGGKTSPKTIGNIAKAFGVEPDTLYT